MPWPKTHTEAQTLEAMHAGHSIARFGDGEFKLAFGGKCVSQEANPKLRDELKKIAKTGSTDKCLVGIPPLDRMNLINEGKQREFWSKQERWMTKFLNPDREYHSSFITRSSNMSYIDTPEFWNRLVDLWRDKDVTLVKGSERSLCSRNMEDAKTVTYVHCLYRDAYRQVDELEKEIRGAGNKIVLLCAGATATVLAWRLAGEFLAWDLGHTGLKGMFKKGRGLE